MDAKTADDTLSLLEAHHYSGVISAHSWDSPQENPRIYNLGGFVTPIAGASPASFISQWRDSLKIRNKKFYNGSGFGYGADMNGLAEQSQPTGGNPITYPFQSYDRRVTFTRERWGQRIFDLNKDGVANYGMYPDWLQELRTLAGAPLLTDMFHGAEAYLEMWERAYGVPANRPLPARGRIGPGGVAGLKLGAGSEQVLYANGQPSARPGWNYLYRAGTSTIGTTFDAKGQVEVVFSQASEYTAGGIHPGSSRNALTRDAHRAGGGLWVGRERLPGGARYIYAVRGGHVIGVGVASHRALAHHRLSLAQLP
jgi:hypothetical protein